MSAVEIAAKETKEKEQVAVIAGSKNIVATAEIAAAPALPSFSPPLPHSKPPQPVMPPAQLPPAQLPDKPSQLQEEYSSLHNSKQQDDALEELGLLRYSIDEALRQYQQLQTIDEQGSLLEDISG